MTICYLRCPFLRRVSKARRPCAGLISSALGSRAELDEYCDRSGQERGGDWQGGGGEGSALGGAGGGGRGRTWVTHCFKDELIQ